MKMTKIALALGIAVVAFQVQAETVYLAGASATAANYRTALAALCSGTTTQIAASAPVDTNLFAVKCSVDFTGIPGVNAVSFNVSGGSFTAVSTSAGSQTAVFLNPNDTTGATRTAARKSDGGFLDIDAAAFPVSELLAAGLSSAPATEPASFSQVFGVAVSPALYTALQSAQGLTGCGIDSLTPACQPSITKTQYASIVSAAFNNAKQNINAVLGVGAEGDLLTVCRRVSTSGTQASSNQYFLNTFIGGDGANGGGSDVADAATYAIANSGLTSFDVQEGSGTGNTRTCLSGAGYAVGVLSLENAPDLTNRSGGQRADRKWRYVKLDGVHAFEGTASGLTHTTTAKAGQYYFWFKSQKFGFNTNGAAVVNAIDSQLASGVALPGLFSNADSAAKRDSNTSPVVFE